MYMDCITGNLILLYQATHNVGLLSILGLYAHDIVSATQTLEEKKNGMEWNGW